MNQFIALILYALILMGYMTACAPTTIHEYPNSEVERNGQDFEIVAEDTFKSVYKFTDPDNGITCYVLSGSNGRGGIDCIEN